MLLVDLLVAVWAVFQVRMDDKKKEERERDEKGDKRDERHQ